MCQKKNLTFFFSSCVENRCLLLSVSFLRLQRGAERWIASQSACPRCGLFRGMRASKREAGERDRERGAAAREEGEGYIAASL